MFPEIYTKKWSLFMMAILFKVEISMQWNSLNTRCYFFPSTVLMFSGNWLYFYTCISSFVHYIMLEITSNQYYIICKIWYATLQIVDVKLRLLFERYFLWLGFIAFANPAMFFFTVSFCCFYYKYCCCEQISIFRLTKKRIFALAQF